MSVVGVGCYEKKGLIVLNTFRLESRHKNFRDCECVIPRVFGELRGSGKFTTSQKAWLYFLIVWQSKNDNKLFGHIFPPEMFQNAPVKRIPREKKITPKTLWR